MADLISIIASLINDDLVTEQYKIDCKIIVTIVHFQVYF